MVSSCAMDGDSSGLVDYDHVVIFVDYSNGSRAHGRFVSVGGMRDDCAVGDDSIEVRDFSADEDAAFFNSLFLPRC